MLKSNLSFKKIRVFIEKNCTIVLKEIRNNMIFQDKGTAKKSLLDCAKKYKRWKTNNKNILLESIKNRLKSIL